MTDILYITGRGGSLDKGLAPYLTSLADSFEGVAVDVSFLKQSPLDQVALIQSKIAENLERVVIANSYGAYLTLQSLVGLKTAPEKVLLLSPVLGIAQAKDRMYMSRPPLTGRLKEGIGSGSIAKPAMLKVLIGNQDELFNQDQIDLINNYFGKDSAIILDDETHMLSHASVLTFLTEFAFRNEV